MKNNHKQIHCEHIFCDANIFSVRVSSRNIINCRKKMRIHIFSCIIQRNTKVCRVKLCINYHGRCTRIWSYINLYSKAQQPREISQSNSRKTRVEMRVSLAFAATVNGHFYGWRLLSVYGPPRFTPLRDARSSAASQPWSARGCWILAERVSSNRAPARHTDEDAIQIVPRARAENKRVTGGSRRAIFGIPTPQRRRDTRVLPPRAFRLNGFSVLRSDTRLTLLRSLGFW